MTEAQQKLLAKIRDARSKSTYVRGPEVRVARRLESLGLIVLVDDGDTRDGLR